MIRIDPQRPDPAALESAAAALRGGGLVLLPTETVYGIAADPRQKQAMQKLYEVKGREARKPVAFFIVRADQAEALGACWSSAAERLADRHWPGPLTLVLPAHDGGAPKGFRMPDYRPALELVRRFGPLAVTSANRSGEKDALTAQEAQRIFGEQLAVYLDAGPSEGGIPSTVVQVMPDGSTRVLREGAIASDALYR